MIQLFVFQHIDHIMSIHGNQIMQAVILILEGDHPVEVKEQVIVCVCVVGCACTRRHADMHLCVCDAY